MSADKDGPRIRVMGSPGSGKTTAGRAIAAALDIPFLELDNIFWLQTVPMYECSRTPEECRALLHEFLAANPAWIIDGNFREWTNEAFAQATEIVVFDIPTYTCLTRLVRRWWVGRSGLRGGDDASLRSMLALLAYTARYRRKLPAIVRTIEQAVAASGAPWSYCRRENTATLLARFPGAAERFAQDVRRGRSEPEAVISGRRKA